MRIGVLSDTHMPRKAKQLPTAVVDAFRNVRFILHAGDWNFPELAEELSAIAPVYGVAGNTDGTAVVEKYGWQRIVEIGGKRIGLVHGHQGLGKSTPDRAYRAFQHEQVDAIVFGHSHIPYRELREGVLLFNPGSPTDKRRQQHYSCGWLEVEGNEIRADWKFFN
ncbi:metallophosphoesterase [Xylanibacillus composti]|nr:metallophosphoesterase [Xylanibacillus composti]MDT9725671.1 metallophosphoesterase [Xylanibacillus composti]